MPRENSYTAIILKKQPVNEADEIITFFTKEAGKVRGLAKSVKLPKSKLQAKLQALFLVHVGLAGNKLPKITAAEAVEVYQNIRQNLDAAKMAFYASETVLKFTPDEQKNEPVFNLLAEFLSFLNSETSLRVLGLGLAKFKIEILQALGFGLSVPANPLSEIYFSAFKGGFTAEKSGDALTVTNQLYQAFAAINSRPFSLLSLLALTNIEELQSLLSNLTEYHLERKVKSEKYLNELQ